MSWNVGISSGACTDCPILDILPILAEAGATGIEVGTPPRHFDPWQEDQVRAVERYLGHSQLQVVSIHAPFGALLDLSDPNPHHRHAAVAAILTSALALERLGGTLVIVHPSDLERHRHDARARLADSARSLTTLAEELRDSGLTLLVESPLPHLVGGHPDEFAWLLSQLDDSVGVCLDTGHTALGGAWHRFVEVAGSRLRHVHLHDNRGRFDDHLPPGEGILDWTAIKATLHGNGFSGWLMLELAKPPQDAVAYFRQAFERTRALFA